MRHSLWCVGLRGGPWRIMQLEDSSRKDKIGKVRKDFQKEILFSIGNGILCKCGSEHNCCRAHLFKNQQYIKDSKVCLPMLLW